MTPEVIYRFTSEAVELADRIEELEDNSPLQFV